VYPKLAHVGGQLVDALKLLGDKEPVDMSLACMCETIDALGLTGFDKPYHNIQCFKEGQPAHMLNVRSPVCIYLAAACLVMTKHTMHRDLFCYLGYAFACSACVKICMRHPPIHDVNKTTCPHATVDCIV